VGTHKVWYAQNLYREKLTAKIAIGPRHPPPIHQKTNGKPRANDMGRNVAATYLRSLHFCF